MHKVIIFVSALASVAFAGTDEIRALIQQKLNMEQEVGVEVIQNEALRAIDCSAHESLYCPLANVPNVQFSSTGGNASSSAGTCCPAKYTQCQIQDNAQYCRELLRYEIPESQGLNQELCPPTTPECSCQQTYNEKRDLTLTFCPNTVDCCPICECHGDPHCRAFGGQQSIWATCDDRDVSCVHNAATCAATSYDGQPCKWIGQKPGQSGYCARADGTKTPVMLMYAKTYKKYFTPSDNTDYQFFLNLTLGTYGSISRIDMKDEGFSNQVYSWWIDGAGNCKSSAGNPWPINGNGNVNIFNLPSTVGMQYKCNPAVGRSPTSGRFDVYKVQDPWYVGNVPILSSFSGFCANGQIVESIGESAVGGCSIADRQIVKYFGCTHSTGLDKCKINWCKDNYQKLSYTAIGGGIPNPTVTQRRTQCNSYVNNKDPAKVKNFLGAVCAVSKAVTGGNNPTDVDPTLCLTDSKCKSCMDDILDFPEEIGATLQGDAGTRPPTPVCPNLLAVGIARKTLAKQISGVVIEYQDNVTSLWAGVFALLNEEIAACECKAIFVNGSDPSALVLTRPGNYRIRQCNGLDDSPNQDMCTSSPGYNTTVAYSNPTGAAIASEPLGGLYDSGVLVCNRQIYPKCPADYPCCVWLNSEPGWEECMRDKYGNNFQSLYPQCTFN